MLKTIKTSSIIAIVVILVLFLGLNSFDTVPVGSTGILLTFGKVEDGKTLSEGLHLKIPFVQQIVSMDNRVKKLELNTQAFSKDIQTVSATLAVNYRLQATKSFSIYKTAGTQYEQNIIVPATHEVLKSVCAQYTAEELISKRAESSDKMRIELDAKLSDMGFTITDFNIIDFDFSNEFINAVESKQVAIKQAEAEAEKLRIQAEAEANAVKLAAEAEAYRLENISKHLSGEIIEKALVDAWDGKLPAVVGSETAGIMNIGDLIAPEAE